MTEMKCAVVTGAGSGIGRATAIAAVRLGLRPYLLLHTASGEPPDTPDGNHLLDLLVGAEDGTLLWFRREDLSW